MKQYKLRYTTAYGLQIYQEFSDKESRDRAYKLIGHTERIHALNSVVRITNHIICIEAIDEDVENITNDSVGEDEQ